MVGGVAAGGRLDETGGRGVASGSWSIAIRLDLEVLVLVFVFVLADT